MDLKKIDLNKLQDYVFMPCEIPLMASNQKFINIKCLDNESIVPTVKAIPIPEGATNGEMFLLTNKNATIFEEEEKRVQVVLDTTVDNHKPCAIFNKTWWNAPYKGVEE